MIEPKDLKPGDMIKVVHPKIGLPLNPWVGTTGEFIRTVIGLYDKRPGIEMKVTYLDPSLCASGPRVGQIMTFPSDDNGWKFELLCKDWDI